MKNWLKICPDSDRYYTVTKWARYVLIVFFSHAKMSNQYAYIPTDKSTFFTFYTHAYARTYTHTHLCISHSDWHSDRMYVCNVCAYDNVSECTYTIVGRRRPVVELDTVNKKKNFFFFSFALCRAEQHGRSKKNFFTLN